MNNSKSFYTMAIHNIKTLSGLVLSKTIQNNTEKHKKKENVWRRERNSWDEENDWLDQGEDKVD